MGATPDLDALAREHLGFASLRPGQREAVEAVLAGHDVLAVMPTAYGKSAIYQLSGLLVDGPTVVVSPLLALQRDQIDALEETDAEAAQLNSTLTKRRREDTLVELRQGSLEFLLLAPEQLGNPETLEALRRAPPSR